MQTYVENMITLQDPNYREILSNILVSAVLNYIEFTNYQFKIDA